MKKAWKWVIGIVVVVVILAALVGVGFVVRNNMHILRGQAQINPGLPGRGPEMMPNGGFGYHERGPEMMPYGGFGYPMRGPSMMGFGWRLFGGLIGGLFMLGFLVLAVLGIIWLVGRGRTQRTVAATAAIPAGTASTAPAEIKTPCKNCGRPLEAEWKVCPHCGKKV
jgi:apolipoprotein N-acyltransferase